MPDLTPAPGSTASSAPNALSFLTVSGVAATRGSAASLSRAIPMRIHPASWDPSTFRSRISVEQQGEGGDRHHAEAHDSGPRPCADPGCDDRDDEDERGRQPMTQHAANRQSEQDIDDRGSSDKGRLYELAVASLVRRHVVAFSRCVLNFAVISHNPSERCGF